ncbi:hypothetical protein ABIA33_007283 [Streptacidiphilus sp. MAP12-16]|uniref:serine protease n=1 Tax=Streptacidiphilus sp. MAP12-16 TaxID=3156300 RepID=UPI00351269D4
MRRADGALVRVSDPGGQSRGVAFPVDHEGTLLTSHEAVDTLTAMLLTWPGGAVRRLSADDVVPLPEFDLALLRTDAVLPPLPLADGHGTRLVTLPHAEHALQGGVAGLVTARYAPADRWHLLADVWLLELDQAPYGLALETTGTPVLDAETGAVVGVATAALRSHRRGAVLAVPLRAAAGHPAVADLLARNAATVPAHGRALNLAGVLELTAATLTALNGTAACRVDRPDGLLAAYPHWSPDRPVQALVGEPGSGRTTELAALAVHRAQSAHRLPTVWLRGADLRPDDGSVLDAVERALQRPRPRPTAVGAPSEGEGDSLADQVCRLAAAAHRPLLVVLDNPEEMPLGLLTRLGEWSAETGRRLRRTETRLVVGCRPEYWEQAGPLFSAEDLQPRLELADLPADIAAETARRYGLPLAAPSRHPLSLRLLAEIRAALPTADGDHAVTPAPDQEPGCGPTRAELLGARIDLACLRIAERLSAPDPGSGPGQRRRLATAAAGRVHEAARRMLGPGGGSLDRSDFDGIFPWAEGWAQAVLGEGLLVPAGPVYRFAHEELSEWLQGGHLDLATALDTLLGDGPEALHRPPAPGAAVPPPHGAHRRGGPRGQAVPPPQSPPQPPPPLRPVPHHRIGPVREALLRLTEQQDPSALEPWLSHLVLRLDGPEAAPPHSDAHWWAANLLTSVLLRLPDAEPHLPLLRSLAARMASRTQSARGGEHVLPLGFWTDLPLPLAARIDLLRLLARGGAPETLDAVAHLLRADPPTALPALCLWFQDEQLAASALHLLRTHRRIALDDLAEALVAAAHPRADALLRELAVIEPSALCRAVDRWAHDPRPERHVAAAVHAPTVNPGSPADRALLRYAAEALLARATEERLHGAALAVLVADPDTRGRHLPAAVARYIAADPMLTAEALAPALDAHPALVLSAFKARLNQPGEEAAAILHTLGSVHAPHAQRAAARLVGEHLSSRPEAAAQVATWLDARTRYGPSERATLLPFVRDLAAEQPEPVRAAFRAVLSAHSTALHQELLSALRAAEPMQGTDQPHGTL